MSSTASVLPLLPGVVFPCQKGTRHLVRILQTAHNLVRERNTNAELVASFPGLPRFCSLVCVQYNTRKASPFLFFGLCSVYYMEGLPVFVLWFVFSIIHGRPPRFCSLVCVQYNTQKQKSSVFCFCVLYCTNKNGGGLGTRLLN